MSDTVLVTGAAGFIGFHLAQRLLADGLRVIGYDRLCGYYPKVIKEARLAQLGTTGGDRFVPVTDDLCDLPALEGVFRRYQPTRVCNLAAMAGVRHSILAPHRYQKANIEGFLNVLECCRHFGTQRLVYASSSSVYGGNRKLPFAVGDRVETPVSLYAATKRANELMAHSYTHLYHFQTVGLRFFTVYGPWGRPDMAMWIFAEKILRDEPIPVFNEGNMKRDFTYVDDIVSGILSCLFSGALPDYSLFNLGNHRMERLLDMIHLLEDALGKEAVLDLQPMQPGDVPASFADISDSERLLGFSPTTPIARGIPKFCDWYRDHPALAETVWKWRRSDD